MADGYSGQEHSFPIVPLYKDVVQFVARTKTFYTPTILVAYGAPWSENYWFETENVGGRPEAAQVDSVGAARQHGPPAAAVVPARGVRPHADSASRWPTSSTPADAPALGSHGQLQGLGAHWETWNLGSGGLTPHETLQVVTLFGAEAIGLQQDVGSLEAGQAGGPAGARPQPAREHPQHQHACAT